MKELDMKKLILIFVLVLTQISFSQWDSCYKANSNGGLPYSILTNGSNIFIGTPGSGVFLSTDNGDNWIEKNTGLTGIMNKHILAIFNAVDNTLFCSPANGLFFPQIVVQTGQKRMLELNIQFLDLL